jgi:hypothetical protein
MNCDNDNEGYGMQLPGTSAMEEKPHSGSSGPTVNTVTLPKSSGTNNNKLVPRYSSAASYDALHDSETYERNKSVNQIITQ